jgi:preprotein translocase subunit SecA
VLYDAGRREGSRRRRRRWGRSSLLRVFRHFYLEEIDRQWVEHLTNMEHLRDGIGLRGYGQRDPKQEYKKEGYDVFVTMMASTSSNVCTKLFKVAGPQGERHRAHRARGRREARAQQRAMQMRHGGEVEGGDEAAAWRRAPPRDPAAARPGAAGAPRGAEDRAQRPLPVRQRAEVQEVPRRRPRGDSESWLGGSVTLPYHPAP